MVCQQNCIFKNLCGYFNGGARARVGVESIPRELVNFLAGAYRLI